jgi:hypothetical protein
MLKDLIIKYGKDKINTLTKYPSILTFHKLGENEILTDSLTTDLSNEKLSGSEKIDGTNVRIISYGNEYLIGSRLLILQHSEDLYFDPTQGIVEGIHKLVPNIPQFDKFTVIYGEFFGGKTTSNARHYGKEKNGFRVFDVAVYDDLSILEKPLNQISKWRETDTGEGIIYGQRFLSRKTAQSYLPDFSFVPLVDFVFTNHTHEYILQRLNECIPTTNVALTESATKKAEGIILRNESRTKIVKIRFKDN